MASRDQAQERFWQERNRDRNWDRYYPRERIDDQQRNKRLVWNDIENEAGNQPGERQRGRRMSSARDVTQERYPGEGPTRYELNRPDWDNRYNADWDYNRWTGPYAGVGPAGYQRSDNTISYDLHQRLTQHGQLDARNIRCRVQDGEVTLEGNIPSRAQKRLAQDLADSVPGVQDVHNHLKIQDPQARHPDRMQKGMDVVGRLGDYVGRVKEIREQDFLVDRPFSRDVYVPFNSIYAVTDQVWLRIREDDLYRQEWQLSRL